MATKNTKSEKLDGYKLEIESRLESVLPKIKELLHREGITELDGINVGLALTSETDLNDKEKKERNSDDQKRESVTLRRKCDWVWDPRKKKLVLFCS